MFFYIKKVFSLVFCARRAPRGKKIFGGGLNLGGFLGHDKLMYLGIPSPTPPRCYKSTRYVDRGYSLPHNLPGRVTRYSCIALCLMVIQHRMYIDGLTFNTTFPLPFSFSRFIFFFPPTYSCCLPAPSRPWNLSQFFFSLLAPSPHFFVLFCHFLLLLPPCFPYLIRSSASSQLLSWISNPLALPSWPFLL